MTVISDPYFQVNVIAQTPNPQRSVYTSMHQCYCEGDAWLDVQKKTNNEKWFGEMIIKHLLAGGRGHYGCLEGPSISFSVIGFPHSVMQQARTHRVGVEFNVQSGRYTSQRFMDYPVLYDLHELVYLRPIGKYSDRQGQSYEYTQEDRLEDIGLVELAIRHYQKNIKKGFAEEHCRSLLPFDFRQNWTVSFNIRSLMHFLDLRAKKDAQIEIQSLCAHLFPHFEQWTPELAGWYKTNRWGKARLAP